MVLVMIVGPSKSIRFIHQNFWAYTYKVSHIHLMEWLKVAKSQKVFLFSSHYQKILKIIVPSNCLEQFFPSCLFWKCDENGNTFWDLANFNYAPFFIKITYLRKWWNCFMVQCDHLNPLEVCLKSLIMNPSSHRHFLAPGPPRYEGGGEPSWTAPSLEY